MSTTSTGWPIDARSGWHVCPRISPGHACGFTGMTRLPRACRNAATEFESRRGSGEQPTTAQVVNCSRTRCASVLRGCACLLLQLLVLALAELLDDLLAERGQVVRVTRGRETAVHVNLLVDPGGACVLEVGLQRRPRRQRQALRDAGVDQRPRTMADRADRLACLDKGAHEAAHVVVHAQEV